MRIGIDARLYGETGVGRYIRNLLTELAVLDTQNEYVIFLRKSQFTSFLLPNSRWEKRLADMPWHSITEQILMPWIFMRERLDILHVPYFNIPIFYPGKMVMTVHDLTILHFDTGKASTLPYLLYKLRRLGYRLVLLTGLYRAGKIITVSQAVKDDLCISFGIQSFRISITHEGVDEKLFTGSVDTEGIRQLHLPRKYILYVGNAYPHKNLDTIVNAYNDAIHGLDGQRMPTLVFVGKEDYFYRRLKHRIAELKLSQYFYFFGEADDTTLHILYTHASALIFPSRMEGFGLPAVEALTLGCPVVCSDIPVFHEIVGNNAIYVDPLSPADWGRAIKNTANTSFRPTSDTRKAIKKKYNWKVTAQKTLSVYQTA